ncbi:MAG: SNF2-related protein [Candidatus Thalassarchaeaceae archaeon]|nr:SNF2-related protein [Candidatus Thalassarchaeaceae archaeon]
MVVSGSNDDSGPKASHSIDSTLRWMDLNLRIPTTDSAPLHHFGRWEDQPHQHLPAARLAASPWRGLLIADEVGLGKTISAIRILRRLHAIGESGGVIVACPGALRSKWRQELHHRGDIDAIVADSGRRLISMIERMAEGEPRVIIVSHGVLRRSSTLEKLIEIMPEMMLTIVDEAHHCRNPRSRLHDAVQLLAMRSQRCVLMTATPVNLRDEELWVQLSLLAPERWPTIEQFHRTMGPTRMLNDVLDGISQTLPNLPRAIDRFRALEQTIGFRGDPRLIEATALALNEDAWSPKNLEDSRQKLANLVRNLRPLNDLLVRTRRRDLDWHLAKRKAVTLDITLSPEEWRLYEAARRWARTLIQMRHPEGHVFDWALIVPERMASSCLPAFARHVLRQLRTQAREALEESGDAEFLEDIDLEEVELRMLRRLGNLSELVEAAEALTEIDSKYDAFLVWLTNSLEHDNIGGVLLFSHFHGTLEHLHHRLQTDGFRSAMITGRTRMDERDLIREKFRNGEIDILLSSEVGSEGLDQQHCHRLVNYDLPWNPMRIEQRIGRLDRFGQMADEIEILNLAVEGTIDAAILHRLYHRIRIFEDALGMLDPLLGEAMRMVARAELDRPTGQQIVMKMIPAEDDEDDDPSMLTLLDKRESWLAERSVEEREWVGPDPGISSLRKEVESLQLGIKSNDLQRWMEFRLGEFGQLHPTREEGVWMLRLGDELVDILASRANDIMQIDGDTVGWKLAINRAANRSGPHWFHVVFDREIARIDPQRIFITPFHPLVRWLCENTTDEGALRLQIVRQQNTPPNANWCVCIDWTVDSLTRTTIRRWLYLDNSGIPLEDGGTDYLNLLDHAILEQTQGRPDELLQSIQDALLDAENRRLGPLIDELRENAEQAWHARISREMAQLFDADMRAREEGKLPDPRWIRMKNGMISRLQDDLAKRLIQLEQMKKELSGELKLRIAIRLE